MLRIRVFIQVFVGSLESGYSSSAASPLHQGHRGPLVRSKTSVFLGPAVLPYFCCFVLYYTWLHAVVVAFSTEPDRQTSWTSVLRPTLTVSCSLTVLLSVCNGHTRGWMMKDERDRHILQIFKVSLMTRFTSVVRMYHLLMHCNQGRFTVLINVNIPHFACLLPHE
jgi:hypothetical protein